MKKELITPVKQIPKKNFDHLKILAQESVFYLIQKSFVNETLGWLRTAFGFWVQNAYTH